ncbi:MAG: site-2 protease family protein [Myxococcales bacterium]|nr:MAG: site-2 protease family protein [Myxococcales bacterium]
MNPKVLETLVIGMPALILSLSVHEFAHAWSATRLGDDTPQRQGRLTLSPLPHMDLFGSLIFPAMLMLSGTGWFFGYAKPVQFKPVNFTRRVSMWQGSALTALAGPFSNLLLAFLAAIGLRAALVLGLPPEHILFQFCGVMFTLNVLLFVFNLFPLPPLDGGYLIPDRYTKLKVFLNRYSMMLFILVFFVPLGNSSVFASLTRPHVA